jgi:hypothetical protein
MRFGGAAAGVDAWLWLLLAAWAIAEKLPLPGII